MVSTTTLTRVNYAAFALHLLLLLSFVVYRFVKKPKKTSVVLTQETLAPPRPPAAECKCCPEEAVESLGATFDIFWAIAAFCAITAAAHLVYATDAFGVYSTAIAGGSNFIRWIECGITASLMLGIVAVLSGIRNLEKLLLLMAANAAVMLQGFYVEKAIFEKASLFEKILPLLVGWALFLFSTSWF